MKLANDFITEDDLIEEIASAIVTEIKGGHGSGNHGHSGRPGKIGGSGGGGTKGRVFSNEEGYEWHEQGQVREWALGLKEEDKKALNDYCGFSYTTINNMLRGQMPMTTERRKATPEERDRLRDNDWREIELPDGSKLTSASMFGEVSKPVVDTEYAKRTQATIDTINETISKRGIVLREAIEVSRAGYVPGLSMDKLKASVGKEHVEKAFTSTFLGPANGRATGDGYVTYGVAESKYKRFNGDIDREEVGTAIKFDIVLPKGTHVASVEAARRTSYKHRDGTYDLDDKVHRVESEVLLGSGARFKILSVTEEKPLRVSKESKTDVPYAKVRMQYIGGGNS